MNGVDGALVVLLVGCAVRGYWRGFFRESFGLVALIGAVAAAVQFTAAATLAVQQHLTLPPPLPAGAAFVTIFVVTHSVLNTVGFVLDRLAGRSLLRGVSRVAGALFGVGKSALTAAFVLLLLHLLPFLPSIDAHIMRSSFARPLVTAASNVLRLAPSPATPPEAPRA